MTKRCTKCAQEKPFSEFSPNKRGLHGLAAGCKDCATKAAHERYVSDPEYRERVHQQNVRLWAEMTQEERNRWNERRREYSAGRREETNEKNRQRRAENPEIGRKQTRRKMARYRTDENFRLKENLRTRVRQAIICGQKAGSAVKDLGCSIPDFRAHIEFKFQPGMAWENWGRGKGKWNIDHIMPLAAFDLADRQHFLLANHYLNLQPLWEIENFRKHDKIPNVGRA